MDNDTEEMTFQDKDGKNYVIAQSLKEQKRANDLKEIELRQYNERNWILFGMLAFALLMIMMIIAAVLWAHKYNIPTRILG